MPARFREVSLGPSGVTADRDSRGYQLLRPATPLGAYPVRLVDRLTKWANEAPDRTFIAKRSPDAADGWRRISYGQAYEIARRVGQSLLVRDLSAERPLMILSENDLEHAMLALAALYVGVPFVPVSPAYSLISQDYGKLRDVVALMTPGLVFVSSGSRYDRAIAAAIPEATEVVVSQDPLSNRPTTRFERLATERPGPAVDVANRAITGDTLTKFLLTSGSTGMPKAVIHTQGMLTSNLQMIVASMPFLAEEPPILVDWLPWNHTFGGNHNVGLTLYNGGTLYIDDGKPTPDLFGESLRNLREIAPTVYFNVPRGFQELARALVADKELSKRFFSRVKMLFYAAASLSQSVWDALHAASEAACGERIVMITGLGMTETSPFAICANWEAGRAGGIGLPAPGTEVRLAPVGEKLEVRYRGPHVTPGFWRNEELTRRSFDEDGFYRSGDAVRFIDPDDPQKGLLFDGRVAEDFKLDTGTWVSVGPLRAKVIAAGAPYVQDVVVTGHDRSEVCAIILPHVDSCRSLCPDLPSNVGQARVVEHPAVRARFQAMLDGLNDATTRSSTRVARAVLLSEPPSLDLGEMTDKGSINQRAVLTARSALVEALYATDAAANPRILVTRVAGAT